MTVYTLRRQVVGRHADKGRQWAGMLCTLARALIRAGSYALTQGLRHNIFAVDFKPFQHGIFQIWSIPEAWLEAPHLKGF